MIVETIKIVGKVWHINYAHMTAVIDYQSMKTLSWFKNCLGKVWQFPIHHSRLIESKDRQNEGWSLCSPTPMTSR